MLPYLSTLENAIVFKGALKMSRFTLLYLHNETGTELLPPVMTTVLSYLEDTYLHVIS